MSDTNMSGTAAAIVEIERLVKDVRSSETIAVKDDRPGVFYMVGPDGTAVKTVVDPPWHDEKLASPAALRTFVERYGDAEKSAVFVADAQVAFVRDVGDRRDKATVALAETPPYQWLSRAAGNSLSQADLVRVLRITLRGCLPSDSTLLALVRNLKFNASADGVGNLQHGRESLGKSVMNQLTGEQQVPEEVRFDVPVYENHPFGYPVVCAIEIFPAEQKFRLTPYPGECRRAMDAALADVAATLTAKTLPPVFFGKA